MAIRRTGFLGLLALLALPALSAENATGKWVASVPAGGAAVELIINLKAEGEKLTGTLAVAGAPATPIADGKVKGEDVTFKLDFDTGQGGPKLTINYTGKLKGDQLSIRSSFSMGEGAPPNVTEFVAKRTP